MGALTRLRRWRGSTTPMSLVTSIASLAVVLSGLIDLVFGTTGGLPVLWTIGWTVIASAASGVPFALGARMPRWVGILVAVVFVVVTILQVSQATSAAVVANNLVLYPMLGVYLGFFFGRLVTRTIIGLAVVGLGIIVIAWQPGMVTTWLNVLLATVFCAEAASIVRLQLDRRATTDALTGAVNRGGLDEALARELARAVRTGEPLTLAIIDVDEFKELNDRLGHAAGDAFLRDLVATVRAHLRPYDTIARIGGDEFVVLMPAATAEDAEQRLSAMREQGGDTWSFGIAHVRRDDTPGSLLNRADERLYAVKAARAAMRRL